MRCSVWREAAENVAESLQKGAAVIAQGRLESRSYETKEGEKRTVTELAVDEIGPNLRRATAQVTKNAPKGQGNFGQQQSSGQQAWGAEHQQSQPASDPWAQSGQTSAPF